MVSLFRGELPPLEICHHTFGSAVYLDEGVLNRSHGGDRQDLLSTPKLVRVQ